MNPVSVVTDPLEFDQLAEDGWDELVAGAPRPSPFLLHTWLRTTWPRDGSIRPAVHVLRRDGVLVGALPLEVARVPPGIRVARFLGSPNAVLADVVMDAGEALEGARLLLDSAVARHGLLDLFALPPEARLLALVEQGERIRRTEAPVLALEGGWEAVYEAKTSSRRRALHRRRWRQLGQRGAVEITEATTGTELETALDSAFRLHAMRWDNRHDVTGFSTWRSGFHRQVVPELGARGVVRLLTIKVGSRPVAFTLSFVLAGRLFLYRLAFDPEYGYASPGVLAVLETIRRAADEGVRVVEFLRGTERYKLDLADRVDPLEEVVAGSAGLATMAWRGVAFGRVRLRQQAVRRRAAWRSRLVAARARLGAGAGHPERFRT